MKAIPRKLFNYGVKGSESFFQFQKEMMILLKTLKARGSPQPHDYSIGAQLLRVQEAMHLSDERILSEIGILFVEGFETTGHTISWTLFCIATNDG